MTSPFVFDDRDPVEMIQTTPTTWASNDSNVRAIYRRNEEIFVGYYWGMGDFVKVEGTFPTLDEAVAAAGAEWDKVWA